MLILFETAAGFALFRTDKPKKLEKVENLQKYINDVDSLRKVYISYHPVSPFRISINSKALLTLSSASPNL
jgi:hypothetical protein